MARIAQEEIERLKHEVPIQRVLEARGIELRKHGAKDLVGLCPLHREEAASFVVSPGPALWHCFGCDRGGDLISLVQQLEGVSFRAAVELLRAGYPAAGAAAAAAARPVKRSTVPKLPCPVEPEADDAELLGQVMAYYHETLKRTPAALGYLQKRGVGSMELIEYFGLGYADRTLGYGLPAKNRKAGAELRGRLQALGILRESGHELFHGSIVAPIRDQSGLVVSAYGRKTGENLRPGTAYHLNLDGQMRGVFNRAALAESKEIIVCEAVFDALTFWAAGFKNVVGCRGVGGFTEEYLEAFVGHKVERALIAFDRDSAGERGAAELSERLQAEGVECYRIEFPKGMDANEYALKVQPAPKSLGLLVRKAVWLGRGIPREPEPEPLEVQSEPSKAAETRGAPPNPAAEREPLLSLAARAAEPASVAPPQEAAPVAGGDVAASSQPSEPPPASPLPASPAAGPALELRGEQVELRLGERSWRVRGLGKNQSLEQLRVNVLCARGEGFHLDTLDLYSARQRAAFVKQASSELGLEEQVLKKDLGRLLLGLEELHERQVQEALSPKQPAVSLSEQEREEALALLKDPRLPERIVSDFERCGVVGEETNKLLGYVAAVSRKLEEPLAIIIQSSSAAGKSSLMEAVLSFMPEEERVKYSAMTGQSLFYMGERDLRYKILAIVEEEGAQRASYALKLLQSEGELSIASTGKDPHTGRLITQEYKVQGPVMIFLTTTAIEIDEELQNRCIVLTVDEEREQTRAIHRLQRERETLEGLWAREERRRLLKLHQNAQRLLRPLQVINPFARELTFLDDQTRTRRDHMKYLVLIRAVALLRQYQKPLRRASYRGEEKPYIEVELQDIALANRLAHEALGRSLDELPPQTKRLLGLVLSMVREECRRQGLEQADYRFSRRDVRVYTGWSDFQVKLHMKKLEELEYVLVHRGGRGQSFVYELLYQGEGEQGGRFVMGLLDVERLGARAHGYDPNQEHRAEQKEGAQEQKEGPRSTQVAGKEPGRRWPEHGRGADGNGPEPTESAPEAETARLGSPVELALSHAHGASRNGGSLSGRAEE
jgi:DNA primase catalytic core